MPRVDRTSCGGGSPGRKKSGRSAEDASRNGEGGDNGGVGTEVVKVSKGAEGVKKSERKRVRAVDDADILHGSFIAADLQNRMDTIYTHIVRHMLPTHSRFISEAGIMEEVDGAILTFQAQTKRTAVAMQKRLHNAKVCGRQWKVEIYPLEDTQCSKEACLVDVLLVPPAPRTLVLRALSGVKGFLSLVDVEEPATTTPVTLCPESESINSDVGSDRSFPARASCNEATNCSGGTVKLQERTLASFVDEGSAQNARAVLSGRLIGTSGVRMFLERRR